MLNVCKYIHIYEFIYAVWALSLHKQLAYLNMCVYLQIIQYGHTNNTFLFSEMIEVFRNQVHKYQRCYLRYAYLFTVSSVYTYVHMFNAIFNHIYVHTYLCM